MINRVILVGRLTKDPELRYTPNGVAVTTFTLAVNRPFTNEQGEREADFIHCVVWRRAAENVANFLKKGSLAGVDGRLQTRSYEGQDGKRVFVTEVVAEGVQFLEPKGSTEGTTEGTGRALGTAKNTKSGGYNQPPQSSYESYSGGYDDPFRNAGQPIDIHPDDLPF
jgi:single-strand DNA-binding protein